MKRNSIFLKNEISKKIRLIVVIAIFLSFVANDYCFAQYVPVPKGLDGKVLYLDGLTELFKGIPVEITNLDTGEVIKGFTGKGTSGRYSFSINWAGNPNVNVKVCNPINCAESNVTLTGVIHDLDLRLNMSIPNFGPNITSAPIINGEIGKLYEYNLESFDWNGDEIVYWLEVMPEGMVVEKIKKELEGAKNTNDMIEKEHFAIDMIEKEHFAILWVPKRDQGGINRVVVKAFDGEFYATQEFEIDVFYENSAPVIVSEPISFVKAGEIYNYSVVAFDNESDDISFEILSAPQGMFLENNILVWQSKKNDAGVYGIRISASDSYNASTIQIFNLTVLSHNEKEPKNPKEKASYSGSFSGGTFNSETLKASISKSNIHENGSDENGSDENSSDENSSDENSSDENSENMGDNAQNIEGMNDSEILQVSSKEDVNENTKQIKVNDLELGFKNSVLMNKLVYKYFSNELVDELLDDLVESHKHQKHQKIFFGVSKEWINDWGINSKNIALYGYKILNNTDGMDKGKWEELTTMIVDSSVFVNISKEYSPYIISFEYNKDGRENGDENSNQQNDENSNQQNDENSNRWNDEELFFEVIIPNLKDYSIYAISLKDDVSVKAKKGNVLGFKSPLTLLGQVIVNGTSEYLPRSSKILVKTNTKTNDPFQGVAVDYEGELMKFSDGTYRYQVTMDSSFLKGFDIYFKEGEGDNTPILLKSVEVDEFSQESLMNLDLNVDKAMFDNPAFKITGYVEGVVDKISNELRNSDNAWFYISLLVIFINIGLHIFLIPQIKKKISK